MAQTGNMAPLIRQKELFTMWNLLFYNSQAMKAI